MFFVVRLWDAFADLIAGRAVDRTMTRWGKFRPFILFFAVPLLVMSFLTFHVPSGWGDAATLLYVYLTYAVLGLLYSLVNIPYGSLASAMTQSVHQRAKLIAGRTLGAAAGSVLISYIIAPQISALRAQKNTLPPDVYLAAGPEHLHQHHPALRAARLDRLRPHVPVVPREASCAPRPASRSRRRSRRCGSNRPLAILCGASFFYLVGFYTVTGATLYYATYVLGDAALAFQVALLSAPASRSSSRRSSRSSSAGSARRPCSSTRASSPSSAASASSSRPDGIVWFALLCLGIKGVGFSLINTLMFALEPDTVEYGEWKSGKRSEGATYAIFSFTRKLTQSIGGAATAWALALGGYVSATAAVAAPEQPESALTAIKVVFGLVPAAAAILAMIVFITYPLTDQRFREVRDETEARKRELEHAVLGDHGAV